MSPASSTGPLVALRRATTAGILVTILCALWFVATVTTTDAVAGPDDQTTVFGDDPSTAEAWISKMDGVHFAQLASDPTLADTVDDFRGSETRAAYRALRPVQGWVTWLASLGGRPDLIAPAVLALAAVSIGALPVAADAVARALGRTVVMPVLVLASPAVIADLWAPGLSEPLATVVVLAGLACWLRDRCAVAVVLFCVAALTRETTLAVPAGVALAEIISTRRVRSSLPLLAAPATYLAWMALVSARVAPIDRDHAGENGFEPVTGFVEGVTRWHWPEWAAALGVVVAIVAILRLREPVLTAIVATHVLLLSCLGTVVWMHWWGFGRVVLPLSVLALVGARTSSPATASLPDPVSSTPVRASA